MTTPSQETFVQVAKHCSEYTPKSCTSNSCCDCERSCTNCGHFSKSELCDLDICNKIIRDHNLM